MAQYLTDTMSKSSTTVFGEIDQAQGKDSAGADEQSDISDSSGTISQLQSSDLVEKSVVDGKIIIKENNSPALFKSLASIKSINSKQHAAIKKENDSNHFYQTNIISTSKDNTPLTSPSKPKSNLVSKRNSLDLNLNTKNKKQSEKQDYEFPFSSDDAKETDVLLENGGPKSVRSDAGDEERHVQFDSKSEPVTDDLNNSKIQHASSPNSSISSSSTSSGSSSSSEESLELSEARPPDGGWGWVVVAASFIVNLIADGITFSFGVIYREFLNYFGENRGTTAWIGSLFMAMPLLSGPIASFLTDRYGCRKVTIIGSVLASTGFIISSTANSMFVLCITFGMLAGFGLSLCYVASVVIVAYYFDKKRSFATGLAVCGSGIGTFIFAPLIQLLLDEYGWRGTTLILAGLFLNLAVCGALMRDLPWTSHRQKSLAKERKRRCEKRKSKTSSGESFSVSNSTNTASVLQTIVESHEEDIIKKEDLNQDRLCSSLVNLPTYVKNGEKVPIEVIELLSTHRNVYNVLMHNYPNLLTPSRSFSDSGRLNETHHMTSKLVQNPLNGGQPPTPSSPTNTDAAYLWWLKRNQITPPRLHHQKRLHTAYLRDLRVHRLSLTYRGAMLNINRYRLRASSCPDIYRNSMTTIAKEKIQWYAGFWDLWELVADMFDFSHFSDPKYLLFAISNFLLYTWYDVPYVYIADNAVSMGFSDNDSSMLVGMIGIVNMFGEIFLGWAGDQSWINAGIMYAVCMGLCGAVTAIVPLLESYWALCAVSGAFGLFIAANYSLTCIILVELITLERFTNAYGLLLLVQGIANLIGPPLGGWICDITGTYDLSFYLAGIFIAISGVLLMILPATKRYRHFQNLQRQASSEGSIRGETTSNEPKFHSILASCITGKIDKSGVDNENNV